MNKTYSDFVTGGRATVINGTSYRPRRGAVVAVVDGTVLRVGWSLCNYKSGDRFNAEIATNLAEGRARSQHKYSLRFGKNQSPTSEELMSSGVPQSVLATLGAVVGEALKKNPELRTVQIFNTQPKPSTTKAAKPIWSTI